MVFGHAYFRPEDHYEEELEEFLKRDKQYIMTCHHTETAKYLHKLFEAIRMEGGIFSLFFSIAVRRFFGIVKISGMEKSALNGKLLNPLQRLKGQ